MEGVGEEEGGRAAAGKDLVSRKEPARPAVELHHRKAAPVLSSLRQKRGGRQLRASSPPSLPPRGSRQGAG